MNVLLPTMNIMKFINHQLSLYMHKTSALSYHLLCNTIHANVKLYLDQSTIHSSVYQESYMHYKHTLYFIMKV